LYVSIPISLFNNLSSAIVSAEPVPEQQVVALQKFALDEVVNLYDVLPMLSLKVEDSIKVISDINYSQITIKELNQLYSQTKEGTKLYGL
jgi:hypothetical protein